MIDRITIRHDTELGRTAQIEGELPGILARFCIRFLGFPELQFNRLCADQLFIAFPWADIRPMLGRKLPVEAQ